MVEKVNGRVFAGEFLGGNLQFYTLTTAVNILPRDVVNGDQASQDRMDKVVEIISLRGQPIIMGAPVREGSSPNFTYVFKFALEHTGAWAVPSPNDLEGSLINLLPGMGFTSGNTDVTVAERL